jgi:glycerate 2-kinase
MAMMVSTMAEADRSRAAGKPTRVLLAPDSFKGTFSAPQVTAALAAPFEEAGIEVDRCPLADGGEGTADALVGSLGGRRVEAEAHDPIGRSIGSSFVLLRDGVTAVVDTAAASGFGLVAPSERDPESASTRGTGELIVAAARHAQRVLVGIGGSATTDGGRGALEVIAAAGGLGDIQVVCLCDVRTPWELAAETFGPQKGADPAAVARLARRLDEFAATLPRDPRGVPMSGGAGGLAGGLWATCGAELADGAAFVLETVEFDARLRRAAAVVTGEGQLDSTTLAGKLVSEVARRARDAGVPVHAVVGRDATTAAEKHVLGLDSIREASTADEIARAADALAGEVAAAG